MSIVEEARREALAKSPDAPIETQASACEQAAIRISLRNLMSFPFVREAVDAERLTLHGWHFNLERGELLRHSPAMNAFEVVVAHR